MILVFKTDLNKSLEQIIRSILSSFKEINQIDFDFEDCDNILRIVANKDITKNIESILNSEGFLCKEL